MAVVGFAEGVRFDGNLPTAAGTRPTGTSEAAPGVVCQVKQMILPGRTSLSDLTIDYVFFSMGVWRVWTPMPDAPLLDFQAKIGQPVQFMLYRSPAAYPFFRGFHGHDSGVGYDCCLWACPKYAWAAFSRFFEQILLADPVSKRMIGAGRTAGQVIDWPRLLNNAVASAEVPVLDVELFGISTTDMQLAMVAPIMSPNTPTVRSYPPDPDFLERARQHFEQHR